MSLDDSFMLSDSVVLPPPPANRDPQSAALLTRLLDGWVLLPEEWEETTLDVRNYIMNSTHSDSLLERLVGKRLLTDFQADSVRKGRESDLILGQYRLLEPIGRGGMGTVYRAEHLHLRRQVAIKVMARSITSNPRLLHRFYAEARAVSKLQHPNIVSCLDAGRHVTPGGTPRDYYVMELIPGCDLHDCVRSSGHIPTLRVCQYFQQICDALVESHRHGLVHRDIKPSNILITPDGQAKLLDFGLALQPHNRNTEPGTLLGTVGYMAPEQIQSPHLVDGRADLFSVGVAMYFALTGKEPFPETGNVLQDLGVRLASKELDVRAVRPEVPSEIAEVVAKLTEPDPANRYQSAKALSSTLSGLVRWVRKSEVPTTLEPRHAPRVLIVDDDRLIRRVVRSALANCECEEAVDGVEGWQKLERGGYELVTLDVNMPGEVGNKLLERIRKDLPQNAQPLILVMSGELPPEALAGLVAAGADDYIEKPFTPATLRSRAVGLLNRRKPASQRGEQHAEVKLSELRSGKQSHPLSPAATISLVAQRLLEEIGQYLPGYSTRLGRYIEALAEAVPEKGEYLRLKDPSYVSILSSVAAAHDIGTLAVPTSIIQKPGRLDADELAVFQSHTSTGARILKELAEGAPEAVIAQEIVEFHHERWDGVGYLERLAGTSIPLSARVVAIASVYEALRSRRAHRPALNHLSAVRVITKESQGEFDPVLIEAFQTVAKRFHEIFGQSFTG